MLELKKNNAVKYVSKGSGLIPVLLADGWATIGIDALVDEKNASEIVEKSSTEDERMGLLSKAKEMGLNPHHKLGVDKLRELLNQGV